MQRLDSTSGKSDIPVSITVIARSVAGFTSMPTPYRLHFAVVVERGSPISLEEARMTAKIFRVLQPIRWARRVWDGYAFTRHTWKRPIANEQKPKNPLRDYFRSINN